MTKQFSDLRCPVFPRMFRREVHEIASNARSIMARDSCFFEIVSENGNDAERFDSVEVIDDLTRALKRVFCLHLVRRRDCG